MNFKGIPYKTEWVEYPDIEALYKKIGGKAASTKPDGSPYYALPLIHDSSTGAIVSDSALIAKYLDNTYPDTPKLFPTGTAPLQHAFLDMHEGTLGALWQFALPKTHTILNPRSQEYFGRTREATFGKKLEDLVPKGEQYKVQWAKVREDFAKTDSYYQQGKEAGPYLLGNTICFGDIAYVSFVTWLKKIYGEESVEWKDIKSWNEGRLIALVDALSKYE